jgi:hypothetical protein
MRLCSCALARAGAGPSKAARVKQVHIVVGVTAIALNGVSCLYGAWCWRRGVATVSYWRVLRSAQAVVVVQVALGGILVLTGRRPSGLHVLYGVLPLLVTLIAEQLRAVAAQTVLDARGLESAQAVGKLPEPEQRGIVVAIVQRELAVMAIAALVVVVLLLRAAQTAG